MSNKKGISLVPRIGLITGSFTLATIGFLSGCKQQPEDAKTILQQIKSDLVVVQAYGKEAYLATESAKFLNIVPLGSTNVVYEAVGIVQAGIDIEKIDIKKADVRKREVDVLLPVPFVRVTLDADKSRVVFNQRDPLGPDVQAKLRDEAEKKALKKIREEVCGDKSLLTSAGNQAKQEIENLLAKSGYEHIKINLQEPSLFSHSDCQ